MEKRQPVLNGLARGGNRFHGIVIASEVEVDSQQTDNQEKKKDITSPQPLTYTLQLYNPFVYLSNRTQAFLVLDLVP